MTRSAFLTVFVLASAVNLAEAQQEHDGEPPRPTLGQRLEQFRRSLLGESGTSSKSKTSGAGVTAAGKAGTAAASRPAAATSGKSGELPKLAQRPTTAGGSSGRRLFSPEADEMDEDEAPRMARPQQPTLARPQSTSASARRRDGETPSGAVEVARKPTAGQGVPTLARPKDNSLDDADPAPPRSGTPTAAGTSSRRIPTLADEAAGERPTTASPSTPSVTPRVARSDRPLTPSIAKERPTEPTVSRLDSSGARAERGVLIARGSPNIGVETTGPRRITVGKEAAYTVAVRNSGETAAQDVVVFLAVPDWAELTEARATTGATRSAGGSEGLQWTLGTLPSGGQHELNLKLVPRKSQPFDLGIRWTCSPVATQTTVEVQEPKLHMDISGPTDVLYGQRQIYKLSISNPGSGDADGVTIHLLPISPGDGPAASHRLGTLSAGETKSVEIELTARQAGRLTIKAEAVGEGGLKAMAVEEVHVRRAGLQVAVSAPKVHYAGAPAAVEIHVRNPGDAAAKDVTITTILPSGAELVAAGQGGRGDGRRGEITWTLDQLPPGGEQTLTAECVMKHEGHNRIEAVATAEGDLKDSSVANTQVLALADLVLEVVHAPGPVPVGQETTYEIRIRNRGTGAAEQVEVVAYFSDGIEPTGVEGGAADLSPGTAQFRPLPSLFPGRDAVLKVQAKAERSGNHRIRVELDCKALDVKLTQEHTKLFYGDEAAAPAALRPVP